MGARLAAFEKLPPRRFSREWFLNGLRTAGWVAIITPLVWVYADISFTKERPARVTLRIHADSADNMVVLNPPQVLTFQLEVKGRRYAIDRFGGAKLAYDAAKERSPGLHPGVDIVKLLSELPQVRKFGVEILTARPKAVDIQLDTLETIPDVPVRFQCSGGEAADVKLTPERAALRVPTSRMNQIDRERLELPTETVDLRDRPAGEKVSLPVRVRPPAVVGCRVSPEVVNATFTVGQRVGKAKEFTVDIQVQAPKSWLTDDTWNQYKFEVKDPLEWSRRKITVRGDRIDLDKLGPEDIQAYIVLTENDKKPTEAYLSRKVQVRFPEGLKLQADAVKEVEFRLVRRTRAGPP